MIVCYYTVLKGLYIIPCVEVCGETEKAVNIRQKTSAMGFDDEPFYRWLPKSKTSFYVLEDESYTPVLKENLFERYKASVEGLFGHVQVQDWLFSKVVNDLDKHINIKYDEFPNVFHIRIDESGYKNGYNKAYAGRPETSGFSYFPEGLTEEEYKSVYRRLSLIYHPDTGIKDDTYFRAIKFEYDKLIARFK